MTSQGSQWQAVIRLGEKLLESSSLAEQRDAILEGMAGLVRGRVHLWLDERLFSLPGRDEENLFPQQPETGVMRRALESGALAQGGSKKLCLALPLRNKELTLGVLQVEHPAEEPFRRSEIDLLKGIGGHIALALMAARRLAVENWRIEQLNLMRSVSAQIANITDLDELTRRVAHSIQETFNYYYVAVFTIEAGQDALCHRSSAGRRQGRQRRLPRLQIRLGEGLIGSVAGTGVEAVVDDIQTEPRFRAIASLPETRAEVALPLKTADAVLGVLDVQSDQPGRFHPHDLLVLRSLADAIATAVEGARLYSDLEKRARQLALAAEVSDEVTSILDMDTLLNRVAELIHERLGFPYIYLFTVHPNRGQIIYDGGSGAHGRDALGYAIDLNSPTGMIPWVARNARTLLVNDVRSEPLYRPSPFPPDDTRSEVAVPLIYDNEVIGILDLQSDRLNAFTEDDRFIFETLADTIAVAMHNADLYKTERWRRQVADSLREVAGLLSADVNLDDVLDAVLKELQRNLPCDVAAIWLLEGEQLHLVHIHGADMIEVGVALQRWPETRDFLGSVLQSGEPTVRKPTDPFGPTGMALGYAADYSSLAVTLRIGEQPLGVLTLSHHTSGRYGHEAKAMTTTFANYAAVAIQNARLYDTAQEQAYASAALLQIAQTVADATALDEILASVVRITPILVGVKGCAIYLYHNGDFQPAQSYGFPDEVGEVLMAEAFVEDEFPLLDAVRASGRMVVGVLTPEIAEDWLDPVLAQTDDEVLYALQTGENLLIGLPLIIKGDLYGVMLVGEGPEVRRFRQKRMEIINSISQQVALSIQNEHLQQEMVMRELLEREVEVARQIQRTFLPDHLPEFPGWDLAAFWRTARQVGGDFYDVFELPGRRLGLFIADVSDKGMPAALFMAMTRTLVRAVVYDTPSPGEALQRVNALILPDNQQGMFVTAVYGVLSLDSGELTYANAGHNPPLWACRADNRMEALERTGAALGVIENLQIEDRTITLEDGHCLLLYTDGLTEAFSPQDELFGMERLCSLVGQNGDGSIQALLDAVDQAVKTFSDPLPLADDMTMLGVKRTVPGAEAALPGQN